MAQLNTLSPQKSEKPFEPQKKLWQLKFPTFLQEGEKELVLLSIGKQQKEKIEHISFWHIDRKKV